MGWQSLIEKGEAVIHLPWTGGRMIQDRTRSWFLDGDFPPEFGWCAFQTRGGTVSYQGPGHPRPELLGYRRTGYLVGNRFVHMTASVTTSPQEIARQTEPVFLIEEGLDKFMPVMVGRLAEDTPFIFVSMALPQGPESEVLQAFLEGRVSVDHIKRVPPGLDAAFRMESYRRELVTRRREELIRRREEELRRREEAERWATLRGALQTGVGRRSVAQADFESAATAALEVGGAQFLDHRRVEGEYVVRFRYLSRIFECSCDYNLRIIDAGICLRDEGTGERGDTYFTLESLPSVIQQAHDERRLVVFRDGWR